MVKRVITKISLSTFVLATGLFLWSNINITNASPLAGEPDDKILCVPGAPSWPDCAKKKENE